MLVRLEMMATRVSLRHRSPIPSPVAMRYTWSTLPRLMPQPSLTWSTTPTSTLLERSDRHPDPPISLNPDQSQAILIDILTLISLNPEVYALLAFMHGTPSFMIQPCTLLTDNLILRLKTGAREGLGMRLIHHVLGLYTVNLLCIFSLTGHRS